MVRAKVNLKYIENATARKVSYNKRRKSLVKKAKELNILCGVDLCALVYGPYDPSPVVWPSTDTEARRILLNYKNKPDMYLTQRKLDLEAFLKQSVTKSQEKLSRLQRRNLELEMENVMRDLLTGRPIEQVPFGIIRDLMWVINDKLASVQNRIRSVEDPNNAPNLEGNEIIGGINAEVGLFGNGDVPFQAGPPSLPLIQAEPPSLPQFQAGALTLPYIQADPPTLPYIQAELPTLPQFQAGPSNPPGPSHFQLN